MSYHLSPYDGRIPEPPHQTESDLDIEVARLTAELAAANKLLAKATEFCVGGFRVAKRGTLWMVYAPGGIPIDDPESGTPWFATAADALAAAEKAAIDTAPPAR
jgi:hypothetical protein